MGHYEQVQLFLPTLRCCNKVHAGNPARLDSTIFETSVDHLALGQKIQFNLFGGEPLIRSDIVEIVDHIQSKILDSEIFITTNASYLRSYGRTLMARNIELILSIDGISSSIHDKIRGEGAFESADANLRWFVGVKNELGKEAYPISVAYTITRYSEAPEDVLRYFESVEVTQVFFSPIEPVGRALLNPGLLLETDELIEFIEQIYVAQGRSRVRAHTNQCYPLLTLYLNAKSWT